MRRFLSAILILTVMAINLSSANAYELFWYDRNAGLNSFSKIVFYPLSNIWDEPGEYQYEGSGNQNYMLNSYINDKIVKKLKKVNFVLLTNEASIWNNNLSDLLKPFDSEQARAKAVSDITKADMYIVPVFRENRIHEDISPSREGDVELKSWTEERNAPGGDSVYDEEYHTVHHVIPERVVRLHIMQIEFTGYDKNGNPILTSLQQDRSYGVSEERQFKDLLDNFRKGFIDAKKTKIKDKKIKKNKEILSLKPTIMTDEEFDGDIYFSNAFDYALRIAALDKIKKVAVTLNPDQASDYYIKSDVTNCELKSYWHEPRYYITDKLVNSESRKWTDSKGKEQTMYIYHYKQEISDSYASWSFSWVVDVDFALYDSNDNLLYKNTYHEFDDKPADAYRHAADKFCKEVNKYFKK